MQIDQVEADNAVSAPRRRRDLVSKAWQHLSTKRPAIFGLSALAVVVAQAESVALVLIALIADAAVRSESSASLDIGPLALSLPVSAAAVLATTTIVTSALLSFLYGRSLARASARLERDARDDIVATFAKSDWEHQSTQKSSRLQGRMFGLMAARADAFTGLVGWIRSITTITIFVVIAAAMSPLAAGVIVIFAAMLSLAVLPLRRRIVRLSALAAAEEVELTTDIAEAADHGPDVHVFNAWPVFLDRFTTRSASLQNLRARVGTLANLLPVVYQYGALALILVVMLVATTSGGELGQFAASALLVLRSVQYGQQLQTSLQLIAKSVPRIELLNKELAVSPPRVKIGLRQLDRIEHIELDNVTYSYPSNSDLALNDVSFELRPGHIVGIAGPSGSGKSTLAQVLMRLRWPTSGRYLINGVAVHEYSSSTWNRLVSHVPQQPRLLHGSLAENVTFFDSSISQTRIIETLQSVDLQDFMQSLPDGLATPLGPTTHNLSGGQIQRLGIARALVRNPRLVILDEPTSALDTGAERIVGDALTALRRRPDVLVIVIAHRASTLALCDEIIILEHGHVAAAGSSAVVAPVRRDLLATTSEGHARYAWPNDSEA